MKNNDYWKKFIKTGKIDDYLHYIACTTEESSDEFIVNMQINKEGGVVAGIDYRDGNSPVSHADW